MNATPHSRVPARSAAEGLTSNEVASRLARYGPNAIPPAPREPMWRRFARQFHNPLVYMLLAAVAVDGLAWWMEGARGYPVEALAIGAILAFNAGLGAWQEHKAEHALQRLREYVTPLVWVFRDGRAVQRDARGIVPGDVLRVEAGDRIAADGILRESGNVAVDESVLTGESLPVDKADGDECSAGTLMVRGRARLEIVRTGKASAMGRLAEMLGDVRDEPTPLERRLQRFGNRVSRWIVALAVVILIAGTWVEGVDRIGHIALFAVALAVAAVPEGLPATLTVTLALGVLRMARRQAVVRKLAAVESLGSVTVIVTDKTGTLTENRMEVRDLDTLDEPRALSALVMANEAEPDGSTGDPLDLALLRYAAPRGVDPSKLRARVTPHTSRPFDASWKYMRATVSDEDGLVSYLKGAPEIIMDRCTLPPAARRAWEEKTQAYAASGFRLVAFAWGPGERESALTWLGVALLWDPPRPEVPSAVRRARAAGIRVIMVTGDHPTTALTVAQSVGIPARRVVSRTDLEGISDADLRHLTRDADIFARVKPEDKLRIVEALQQEGAIVAMTGDGVNDAPALKQADVGVAMGKRGSDVTREVADLVLLDDNFATIVAAVEEGRSIYANIEKFIRFLFSTNLSEVLLVTAGAVGALALGLRTSDGSLLLPLTAAQLLWVNLVTDGAPALALGVDRNPGVMSRPPHDPSLPLLDRPSLQFVLVAGIANALVALTALAVLPWTLGDSPETARTTAFFCIVAGQLACAYPARHAGRAPPRNPWLHAAVAGSLLLQMAVLTLPALMVTLDTTPLPARNWAVGTLLVALSFVVATGASRRIWGAGTLQDTSPSGHDPFSSGVE